MPTPGPLELVIILVIALLILGPGKLPDVGAALGKSIREFRKASTDVQDAVKVDTSPAARRPARRRRRSGRRPSRPPPQTPPVARRRSRSGRGARAAPRRAASGRRHRPASRPPAPTRPGVARTPTWPRLTPCATRASRCPPRPNRRRPPRPATSRSCPSSTTSTSCASASSGSSWRSPCARVLGFLLADPVRDILLNLMPDGQESTVQTLGPGDAFGITLRIARRHRGDPGHAGDPVPAAGRSSRPA